MLVFLCRDTQKSALSYGLNCECSLNVEALNIFTDLFSCSHLLSNTLQNICLFTSSNVKRLPLCVAVIYVRNNKDIGSKILRLFILLNQLCCISCSTPIIHIIVLTHIIQVYTGEVSIIVQQQLARSWE